MVTKKTNVNKLYADKFRLIFHQLPNLNLTCRTVTIPGISVTPLEINNPHNYLNFAGNKVRYEDLSITFKVDEDLNNYKEIANWLIGLGAPQEYKQFTDIQKQLRSPLHASGFEHASDVTLTTLTNASNMNVKINLKNVFPISLSAIDLGQSNNETVDASVSFRYDYFTYG